MVNHIFQPNEVFKGKVEYKIQYTLGDGHTAIVYSAVPLSGEMEGTSIALKIMKSGLGTAVESRFKSEANHLVLLNSLQNEIWQTGEIEGWQPGMRRIVLMYDHDEGSDAYLAQELLSEQVTEIIQNNGVVREDLAVIIAEQFCGVLTLLHGKYKYTYSDMKLDNIWWIEAEKSIRVTDWNAIDPKLEMIPYDVYTFAGYFVQMLLGRLPFRAGTTELIEHPTRYDNFHTISYGAQQIIRKAFHYNPALRYQTARELGADLRRLSGIWAHGNTPLEVLKAIRELVSNASQRLQQAGQPGTTNYDSGAMIEAADAYHQANAQLDIAVKRFGLPEEQRENLRREIAKGLASADNLETGKQLFNATDYARAQDSFERGLRAAAVDLTPLRRWLWLSQIPQTSGSKFVQHAMALANAVNLMQHDKIEKYAEAITIFKGAQQILKDDPTFNFLLAEASGWHDFLGANAAKEEPDYEEAARLYKSAREYFARLPREAVEGMLPDLDVLIKNTEAAHLKYGHTDKLIEDAEAALLEQDIIKVLAMYREVCQVNPDSERLWESWNNAIDSLLTKEEFGNAYTLLEAARVFKPNDATLKRRERMTANLLGMHQAMTSASYRSAVQFIRHLTADEYMQPIAQRVLGQAVPQILTTILSHKDFTLARMLLNSIEPCKDQPWAQAIKAIYESAVEKEHQSVLDHVRELRAKARQAVTDANGSGYDQAFALLDEAERMLETSPAVNLVGDTQKDIHKERSQLYNALDRQRQQNAAKTEANQAEMERELRSLQEHRSYAQSIKLQLQAFGEIPAGQLDLVRDINDMHQSRLAALISVKHSADRLRVIDPQNREHYERIISLVQDELREDAEQKQTAAEAIEQLRSIYENGHLDTLYDQIEELSHKLIRRTDEYDELLRKIEKAQEFREWMQEFVSHPSVIDQSTLEILHQAAEEQIPAVYWLADEAHRVLTEQLRDTTDNLARGGHTSTDLVDQAKQALRIALVRSHIGYYGARLDADRLRLFDLSLFVTQFDDAMRYKEEYERQGALSKLFDGLVLSTIIEASTMEHQLEPALNSHSVSRKRITDTQHKLKTVDDQVSAIRDSLHENQQKVLEAKDNFIAWLNGFLANPIINQDTYDQLENAVDLGIEPAEWRAPAVHQNLESRIQDLLSRNFKKDRNFYKSADAISLANQLLATTFVMSLFDFYGETPEAATLRHFDMTLFVQEYYKALKIGNKAKRIAAIHNALKGLVISYITGVPAIERQFERAYRAHVATEEANQRRWLLIIAGVIALTCIMGALLLATRNLEPSVAVADITETTQPTDESAVVIPATDELTETEVAVPTDLPTTTPTPTVTPTESPTPTLTPVPCVLADYPAKLVVKSLIGGPEAPTANSLTAASVTFTVTNEGGCTLSGIAIRRPNQSLVPPEEYTLSRLVDTKSEMIEDTKPIWLPGETWKIEIKFQYSAQHTYIQRRLFFIAEGEPGRLADLQILLEAPIPLPAAESTPGPTSPPPPGGASGGTGGATDGGTTDGSGGATEGGGGATDTGGATEGGGGATDTGGTTTDGGTTTGG